MRSSRRGGQGLAAEGGVCKLIVFIAKEINAVAYLRDSLVVDVDEVSGGGVDLEGLIEGESGFKCLCSC